MRRFECFIWLNYDSAIQQNEMYAKAYYDRGKASYNLKDNNKAIVDFSRAIQLHLGGADVYYQRGLAEVNTHQKNNACSDFQKSCNLGNANACKMYDRLCSIKVDSFKVADRTEVLYNYREQEITSRFVL